MCLLYEIIYEYDVHFVSVYSFLIQINRNTYFRPFSVTIYLSIYLYISIYPSIYLIYLSINLPVCLSIDIRYVISSTM
jgi:hypothetical protein